MRGESTSLSLACDSSIHIGWIDSRKEDVQVLVRASCGFMASWPHNNGLADPIYITAAVARLLVLCLDKQMTAVHDNIYSSHEALTD